MTILTPAKPFEHDIPALVTLLTQQRDAYRQLSTLSDQQSDLIARGETEQLLTVLSQRQGLVDVVGQIHDKLAPYRQPWEQRSAALSDEQRPQVRQLLDEVETLLGYVLQQDDEARRQLEVAQKKIGSQLSEVARAGSALNAYKGAASTDARFTDKQG